MRRSCLFVVLFFFLSNLAKAEEDFPHFIGQSKEFNEAVFEGDVQKVSSFLDSGVDVEVKEENGKSILEVSLGFYFMTKVVGFISDKIFSLRDYESEVGEVSSNYLAIIKDLVGRGACVDSEYINLAKVYNDEKLLGVLSCRDVESST
jgi:hypothetical protein